MTTYKGNAGHLMQHWTLCELVNIADEQYVPGLNYIDAHAMAPIAHTPTEKRADRRTTFNGVRGGLRSAQSVYERAWYQLEPNHGYPNGANFVQHVWTRDFSMLLCENNPATVTALDAWLPHIQRHPRCERAKVFFGDWRDRFREGLPTPAQVGLPDGSLTLVSFDPDMYYPNPPDDESPRNIYPRDLELTLTALRNLSGGIVIQLSTYSRGNRNQAPQDAVIASVHSILMAARFTRATKIRLNGDMMSLVYARDISWWAELAKMPSRFNDWCPR